MFGIKKKIPDTMTPEEAYNKTKTQSKEKDALPYYLYAAEKGYVEAQYSLARHYELGIKDKKDMAKALYWFEKAAEQGDMFAQTNCAVMYQNGEGCEDCFFQKEMSLYWSEKAAKQGHVPAMVDCGNAYYTGTGCPKNESLAYYWYEEAAMRGNEQEIHNLNILRSKGISGKF